jgi:transcription initiation factor TFIID subunit 10
MADANPDPPSSDSTLPNIQTQPPTTTTTTTTTNNNLDANISEPVSLSQQAERELDAEINHPPDSSDAMNHTMDGSSDQQQQQPTQDPETPVLPAIEPRIPQKKDASLREFLGKMDDYAPIIPDAVTDYYLTLAGFPPPPETDRRLARLLALATQKFIADIAADAYQYSRIRSTNTTSNNPLTGLGGAAGFGTNMVDGGGEGGKKGKDAGKGQPLGGPRAGYGGGGGAGGSGGGQGRTVLTMEDLGMAVGEYGVNVKRGEFYR